jgi:hypothetical protein
MINREASAPDFAVPLRNKRLPSHQPVVRARNAHWYGVCKILNRLRNSSVAREHARAPSVDA